MTAFINCIFVASAFLNFYYLYNLSNLIRLKYYVNYPHAKTPQIIRGEDSESPDIKSNNFREMNMQTRQLQPRLIQMNYDNNTASIYKYVTNLHVVGLF